MKHKKSILVSIIIILIFFSFVRPVQASIFSDDDKDKSEIEETIKKDDGGLFEKVIAKMIRRCC